MQRADKHTKTSSSNLETGKGQRVINHVGSFSIVAENCIRFFIILASMYSVKVIIYLSSDGTI